MTAAALVQQANAAGIVLRLVDGKVKASGSPAALATVVPQLRDHRSELVEFLADAHVTTTRLLEVAMRACDFHGDDREAREQMRDACMAIPLHLRSDLIKHFESLYSPPFSPSLPGESEGTGALRDGRGRRTTTIRRDEK